MRVFAVRLDDDQKRALEVIAQEHRVGCGAVIRWAIDEFLQSAGPTTGYCGTETYTQSAHLDQPPRELGHGDGDNDAKQSTYRRCP